MRKAITFVFLFATLTGCTGTETSPTSLPTAVPFTPSPVPDPVTPEAAPSVAAVTPTAPDDLFSQMGVVLPPPACSGLTPSEMEGPYYQPNTPQRNSLLEAGVQGRRLVLAGYVLDQNCQPLPNAWLDFWQADGNGEYDNTGNRLRGHQFTDAQGRYFLETVVPGLYASRPIQHIHVKVQPEGGEELTTQLYFSQQPVEGLTPTLEQRADHLLGYFNFVVQK